MYIDYRELQKIATNQESRSSNINESDVLLSNCLSMLSNLTSYFSQITSAELAMIINSLNRWQDKKKELDSINSSVGNIYMIDFGLNYSPVMSYAHPGIVLYSFKNLMLVLPVTSSDNCVNSAYHPVDNPSGKWFYRKVTKSDGFLKDSAVAISNIQVVSKTAILNRIGQLSCDLNDPDGLFVELQRTVIQHFFPRLFNQYNNLMQENKEQASKIAELEQRLRDIDN